MTMKGLRTIVVLVTMLGVGRAEAVVPCQPLPTPTVTVQVVNMATCQDALEHGGLCAIRTIVTNVGTTTIALSRDLTMTYSGTSLTAPPASGVRPAGKIGITRSGITLGAGKNIVLTNSITVLPGSLFACWESALFSANTACGNDDERRQHSAGLAGVCATSHAFTKPNTIPVKQRINCSSPQWNATGGTCQPGHGDPAWEPQGCWMHDQLFTRALSAEEVAMWGALNCCVECNQPETIPFPGSGGGPSGYDLTP